MKLTKIIYDEKIFLIILKSKIKLEGSQKKILLENYLSSCSFYYQNQRIENSVRKLSFILFLLISKSKNRKLS